MNGTKLNEIIKDKKIVIPLYFLRMCNELDLNKRELLLLLYLYNKITLKIMEELNSHEELTDNIHDMIELEFNRKLTPLEHDVINDWDRNNYDKLVIKEAVKEASINGVSNLRYIDKILYDWYKKGIRTINDLKNNKEQKEESIDNANYVMDDWLNMDDDE